MRIGIATEGRDYGTPELRQHKRVDYVALESERLPVAKARVECVLDRYEERAQISERQHEAGLRLRRLWRRVTMPAATTAAYGDVRGGGRDMADRSGARRELAQCLMEAGLAVRNDPAHILVLTSTGARVVPERFGVRLLALGHVAIAVCGLDEWAGGTRRLVLLREALTAIADFFDLPA